MTRKEAEKLYKASRQTAAPDMDKLWDKIESGLTEKTMAALRHGISTVVIPKANEKDLEEIDQTVRKHLQFVTAETVDTVLHTALDRSL